MNAEAKFTHNGSGKCQPNPVSAVKVRHSWDAQKKCPSKRDRNCGLHTSSSKIELWQNDAFRCSAENGQQELNFLHSPIPIFADLGSFLTTVMWILNQICPHLTIRCVMCIWVFCPSKMSRDSELPNLNLSCAVFPAKLAQRYSAPMIALYSSRAQWWFGRAPTSVRYILHLICI